MLFNPIGPVQVLGAFALAAGSRIKAYVLINTWLHTDAYRVQVHLPYHLAACGAKPKLHFLRHIMALFCYGIS